MKLFYELLGASADDDEGAVKKAFRKAVKAYHPDLHPNDPDTQERFRQIIATRALLSDAKRRAACDRLLQLERQQLQSKLTRRQLRLNIEQESLSALSPTTTRRSASIRTTPLYSMTGPSCGNDKGPLTRHPSIWIG